MSTSEAAAADVSHDRLTELKAFDDTKAGVKGLVDSGITTVPSIFLHHHHDHHRISGGGGGSGDITIPVIDLSAASSAELVAQVKAAAETVGFFHLVNHGVPMDLLAEMLTSVRRFNESPLESKRPYYTRDPHRRLRFNSNFDLFQSPAANWRDTLFFSASSPDPPPRRDDLPPAVRHVMLEYAAAARAVAARVLELLSEAMGLPFNHLAGIGCADGVSLVCNYYPPCPEPERTMGCSAHSDPSFLTVLLRDAHDEAAPAVGGGGLQARLGGGWVDVPAVDGALLVNVGDLLQLVSNGRFRSVEHRVVANRSKDVARVSVACFCNADIARSTRVYGPIPELVSGSAGDGEGRPMYRSVTVPEFLAHYDKKGLDGRPALDHFKLQ